MFAAMPAAACKPSLHKHHSSKKNYLTSLPPKHIIWTSSWSFRTEKAENKVAREGREAEEFSAKMQLFLLSYQVSRVHIQEVSFLTLAAP